LLAVVLLGAFALLSAGSAVAEMPESQTAVADAPDTAAVMTSAELVAMADEVADEVAELRGWPFKTPVPKNVRTEDELRAYMIETFAKDFPGDLPDRVGASLSMVGLLPAGADLMSLMMDVLMNQVGGFYDPPTKTFYMINRQGVSMPPAVMQMMVAHELTHALDDQYVSLDALVHTYERTEDSDFAVASVVEGSATILMSRYLTRLQLAGKLTMQDLTALMESEMERSKPLMEAPPYFHTIIARYTLGMLFLLRNDLTLLMNPDAGKIVGDRFLAAAADPPRSSEQILHPEKYWEEGKRDLPVTVDDAAVEQILAEMDLAVRHRETFGEILVAMACRPEGTGLDLMNASSAAAWTDSAAMGWGGDRFYLLAPEGFSRRGHGRPRAGTLPPVDDLRGLWITAWDTPRDRDEFTTAYLATRADNGGKVVLMGDRVAAVLFNLNEAESAALEKALVASPPAFAQGDAPWTP
jgi:hypothetical protein